MKRRFRLTKSTDVQRVRRYGRSYAHPLLVLIALSNQTDVSRFGITAGRSVGKAVQRNRAKRLLRAAVQSSSPEIVAGWDIVLIARLPTKDASYYQVQSALVTLLRRASLLQEVEDV